MECERLSVNHGGPRPTGCISPILLVLCGLPLVQCVSLELVSVQNTEYGVIAWPPEE